MVRRFFYRYGLLPLALVLAGCSGGNNSNSGAAAGRTPFTGPWFLVATLNVNVAGAATFLTDTTRIVVGADGNVVITSTDSECSLNIVFNANVITYVTTCLFTATTEDATAPCSLTLRATAIIRGPAGSARASGSFGPRTDVCSGVAVSYAGNLVANQGGAPADDMDDMDDTNGDTDTGDDTEAAAI